MDPITLQTIQDAEDAATRLVATCGEGAALCKRHPRAVAQVNRTSKWLLHALAALQRELNAPAEEESEQKS